MLTEDERARLRAEEVFRAEVKEELAGQKERKGSERVWSFLNSAFGLWLLSAVVLTGLGGVITWWQHHQSEQRRQAQQAERLRAEIECRVLAPLLEHKPDFASIPNRIFLAPGPQSGCLAGLSTKNLASLFDELALLVSESDSSEEASEAARKAQLLHAHWVDRPLAKTELAELLGQLSILVYWKPSATTDTLFAPTTWAPPVEFPDEEEVSGDATEDEQTDETETPANPAPTPDG